jgi:hypothetical protein
LVTLDVDFGPGELPAYGDARHDTVPLLEHPAGRGGPEDSLLAPLLPPFPAPGTGHRAGA